VTTPALFLIRPERQKILWKWVKELDRELLQTTLSMIERPAFRALYLKWGIPHVTEWAFKTARKIEIESMKPGEGELPILGQILRNRLERGQMRIPD
jgi:hypothetical protein